MIEIFRNSKESLIFLDYFIYCLRKLRYKYEIKYFDENTNYDKYNILIKSNSKQIIIDYGDDAHNYNPNDMTLCNKYVKCQYLIENNNKNITIVPLFRSISNTKCGYNIKNNPFIYFKKFHSPEKKYKVVSYTNGHHSPGRLKIYKILEKHFPNDFKLISSSKRDKTKCFRDDGSLSYEEYIKFISSGYFILNLIGKMDSNPLRCVDGYLSNTCVVSDDIITKAFSDFPRYDLNISTKDDKFDENILIERFKNLIDNYQEIYDDLIILQNEWMENNFNEKNYVESILG